MKATGVIRRIDELGRIVIPKEIRKNLRLLEGENLEIYINNNEEIILKKYSLLNNINDFSQKLSDVIYAFTKKNIVICDTSQIIAVSGKYKKEYLNQQISSTISNYIIRRESIIEKYNKKIRIIESEELEIRYCIVPILCHGDTIGVIIMFDENIIDEEDYKIIKISAEFLGKYAD